MDVFVGGATGSTGSIDFRSSLTIRGGTFVGLTLTLGEGLGSNSTFAVEGSHATAISPRSNSSLSSQQRDPGGTPATSTLSFTLDEHGVTPIMIQSRFRGLHIEHDAASHCTLRIALSAIPPRDDVTLITSRAPSQGTFDNLPEGSKISATFARSHTYEWTLTYRGGASGHDLVLHNISDYSPGAPVTPHQSRSPRRQRLSGGTAQSIRSPSHPVVSVPRRGRIRGRHARRVVAAAPSTSTTSTTQAPAACEPPSTPQSPASSYSA